MCFPHAQLMDLLSAGDPPQVIALS